MKLRRKIVDSTISWWVDNMNYESGFPLVRSSESVAMERKRVYFSRVIEEIAGIARNEGWLDRANWDMSAPIQPDKCFWNITAFAVIDIEPEDLPLPALCRPPWEIITDHSWTTHLHPLWG